MDDDKIIAMGGDEDDIRKYAEQNGADLTKDDFVLIPDHDKYSVESMIDALHVERGRKPVLYAIHEAEERGRKSRQSEIDFLQEEAYGKPLGVKKRTCSVCKLKYPVEDMYNTVDIPVKFKCQFCKLGDALKDKI